MLISSAPIGYRCLRFLVFRDSYSRHAVFILLLTFICYMLYHASRKPISVAKSVLHTARFVNKKGEATHVGWAPFNQPNWSHLVGGLEYTYLLVYALSMVLSGYIAERTNLRHFLTIGMLLSGLTNIAFGAAYYMGIHHYYYFMCVQLISGIVQATGWPAVVTLMGNWWGKKRRGFVMGLWNAHTSVGNIVGSLVAGYYVESSWGMAFIMPGLLIMMGGILVFFTLIERPENVQLQKCDGKSPYMDSASNRISSSRSISQSCVGKWDSTERLDRTALLPEQPTGRAITFWEALCLPNVLAYSVLLFFAKLVSYTFLYWLPNYLSVVDKGRLTAERAAQLSVVFDLGGILGGILAGLLSDSKAHDSDAQILRRRAVTCSVMLAVAVPMLLLYQLSASASSFISLATLFFCGLVVNGPYALITTAVSADLGTQRALQGRARALATITSIIDGTGSFGAALGPFLTGLLVPFGWSSVFLMLITSDLCALSLSVWIAYRSSRQLRLSTNHVIDTRRTGSSFRL
ncbi:hypothetical protein EG68_01085 [Paragonimus skrjabini miyazakii]|uniref:Sugar phosphate exchanger 3 n=1 Tax=Paragonimus skrjabini miyazakii TaxID=59628 RepID=A0A8S9Z824_9TREM|nr:hypothetical protein EG68_01085 [Paragonimus skrjabini miyazakii]